MKTSIIKEGPFKRYPHLGIRIETEDKRRLDDWIPDKEGVLHELIKNYGFVVLDVIEDKTIKGLDPKPTGRDWSRMHMDSPTKGGDFYVNALCKIREARAEPTSFIPAFEHAAYLCEGARSDEEAVERLTTWKAKTEAWLRIIHDENRTHRELSTHAADEQWVLGSPAIHHHHWTEFPDSVVLIGTVSFPGGNKLFHGCIPPVQDGPLPETTSWFLKAYEVPQSMFPKR